MNVGEGVLTIPRLQWNRQKNMGPVGSLFCDVPQPEGALRRLTMASAPGLAAVLRIVPLGDNVALGEVVQRVLSASLTPRKVFGGGKARRKLVRRASLRTRAV